MRKIDEKELMKLFILFCIGGVVYMLMEIGWRGYTHWSMGIVGGLCFIAIGGLNDYLDENMSVWYQGAAGALTVTFFEFCSGVLVNLVLKWDVWDYSHMPFNFMGQICLPFSIAWFFVSLFGIVLDDKLRNLLFDEPMPKYKIF